MSSDLPNYSPDPTLTAQQHHILALLAQGRSSHGGRCRMGVHRNMVRN